MRHVCKAMWTLLEACSNYQKEYNDIAFSVLYWEFGVCVHEQLLGAVCADKKKKRIFAVKMGSENRETDELVI